MNLNGMEWHESLPWYPWQPYSVAVGYACGTGVNCTANNLMPSAWLVIYDYTIRRANKVL